MIQAFKNDDAGFIAWVRDHNGGFALHKQSSREYRLHLSDCGHIYELGASYRLTASEKICSESEAELRRYARDGTGRTPGGCETCGT